MPQYEVQQILCADIRANKAVDDLLDREGIRRDKNLDYTCGLFDEDGMLAATGSCCGNTLRCLAVRSDRQGEGLLNTILTHLVDIQYRRGNTHLFLYTKCSTAKFFRDSGFYEIARVKDNVVFMENTRNGFPEFIRSLGSPSSYPDTAAIVMNANPFTYGHLFLAETAAAQNSTVHIFVVSEDRSLFPADVRRRLVVEGTAHLKNVIVHDTGSYIISSATFPSYFQKDENAVIEGHARLDAAVFIKIAAALGITRRYVGEEPFSLVTGIYNRVLQEELPAAGIRCTVIPRKSVHSRPVSASDVRLCIQSGDMAHLAELVPPSTLQYLQSKEAESVILRIRSSENVVHY